MLDIKMVTNHMIYSMHISTSNTLHHITFHCSTYALHSSPLRQLLLKSNVSYISIVTLGAPEVPPGPHLLTDMDSSLTFVSPAITRYPLMLQLDVLLP